MPLRKFLVESVKMPMCRTRKSFHSKNVLQRFNKIKDIKNVDKTSFSSGIRGYVIRGQKKFLRFDGKQSQSNKIFSSMSFCHIIGFCQNVFWTSKFSSHSSLTCGMFVWWRDLIYVSLKNTKSSWYNHRCTLYTMCNTFIQCLIS